jgi:hypothetical protein
MRLLLTLAVTGMLFASAVFAQSGGGTISGTITDADRAVLPMTPVQATNTATKAVYKATSSAKGEYSIEQLPAGAYDVSAVTSAIIFRPFERKGVAVRAGQIVRLDIQLQDGVTLNTLGEDRVALALAFRKPPPPDGPVPRLADGKPDLSGMWRPAGLPDDPGSPQPHIQAQPWAEAIAKQRRENDYKDIPSARCLPNGITVGLGGSRYVHTPALLAILFEGLLPRQVFLDGRGHPKEVNPTWMGHSIGQWEGDTLVVDTAGFNDKTWLDMEGHPHTERMHMTERYHRSDLGHMEVEMTVEDPGALVKPWTMKQVMNLDPKEDVMENFCTENERDAVHLGK